MKPFPKYEEVGGSDRFVFRLDENGRATQMFRHSFGPSTYERVPWYRSLAALLVATRGRLGYEAGADAPPTPTPGHRSEGR